jgi:hypothetical protein
MQVERLPIALALSGGLLCSFLCRFLCGVFCTLFCAPLALAADATTEQIVGGIEAVVFVCTTVDAKSAKIGADMLKALAARDKLDLPAIRKTESYLSIYNSEVNRLLLLPAKDRLGACQSAW